MYHICHASMSISTRNIYFLLIYVTIGVCIWDLSAAAFPISSPTTATTSFSFCYIYMAFFPSVICTVQVYAYMCEESKSSFHIYSPCRRHRVLVLVTIIARVVVILDIYGNCSTYSHLYKNHTLEVLPSSSHVHALSWFSHHKGVY